MFIFDHIYTALIGSDVCSYPSFPPTIHYTSSIPSLSSVGRESSLPHAASHACHKSFACLLGLTCVLEIISEVMSAILSSQTCCELDEGLTWPSQASRSCGKSDVAPHGHRKSFTRALSSSCVNWKIYMRLQTGYRARQYVASLVRAIFGYNEPRDSVVSLTRSHTSIVSFTCTC